MERNPLEDYSKHPWNLNRLPYVSPSLFTYIPGNISGMTVPWLYVGQCFSTFCWHTEDHHTYSINYLHLGAPKSWYGIPSSCAELFEICMRKRMPELFERDPDLLWGLTTMLDIDYLISEGVEVVSIDQHAGEFVVTFPQSYHAGFNQGVDIF
jgi:hypothetical protein